MALARQERLRKSPAEEQVLQHNVWKCCVRKVTDSNAAAMSRDGRIQVAAGRT